MNVSKYKKYDSLIVKLYSSGNSCYAISKVVGLKKNTVDYRLKVNGIKKRSISESLVGKPKSEEHKQKLSKIRRDLGLAKGSRNPKWKGGITSMAESIRKSDEYRIWRHAIFERDNYTCQECGDDEGGNLHAHHIKLRREFPELTLAIDNGITLCVVCHIRLHSTTRTGFTCGELLGNPNVKTRAISSRALYERRFNDYAPHSKEMI